MDKDLNEIIVRRLMNLETHLVNFISSIQGIHEIFSNPQYVRDLTTLLNKPLLVDDRGLSCALKEFKQNILQFREDIKSIDVTQTFGEIKYIGNRLNNIEKILSEIRNNGIEKKIRVDLTLDGYEMTKKKINYKEDEQDLDQEDFLRELLSTLSERESKVLIHRFGLLGEKKKTQESTGKIFGISRERIRQIELKAIRKLRHPTRIEKVRLSTNIELRKSVIGE